MDDEIPTALQVAYAHRASWCVQLSSLFSYSLFCSPPHSVHDYLLLFDSSLGSCLCTAHESAVREAKLRLELGQSRTEQREYLANVELARVLDKRAERAQAAGKDPATVRKFKTQPNIKRGRAMDDDNTHSRVEKRRKKANQDGEGKEQLESVLSSIF